jgi:hypothetical protein
MLEAWAVLPAWPLQWPAFGTLAALVAAAIGFGEVAARLREPRLLGYVAAGGLLAMLTAFTGPLFALPDNAVAVAVDMAAAVVLFELGQRVSFGWIRRNPALLASSLAEAGLTLVLVWTALRIVDVEPLTASIVAAIAMATSPAVLISITRELRAQGQVTERALLLTALNCIYAVVVAHLLLAWGHLEVRAGFDLIVLKPAYLVFGSLLVGMVAARLLLAVAGLVRRARTAQWMFGLCWVILVFSVAEMLELSTALALLAFGGFARSLDKRRRWTAVEFGPATAAAVVLLFALSAATVSVEVADYAWGAAVVLVIARSACKLGAVVALSHWAGLGVRRGTLVGVALLPMAALALLLARDVVEAIPALGREVAGIVLPAVIIMVAIGTLAAVWALRTAQETRD